MNEILTFIQANMGLIVIGVALFFVFRFAGGLIRGWRQQQVPVGQPGLLVGLATPGAVVVVVVVLALTAIAIIRPQIFAFFWSADGPFGPSRQVEQARAGLIVDSLNPANQPSLWPNGTSRAAAEAVASDYKLATAKNKAGVSQATAESACYLPKGHPERKSWDDAGLDPCESSVPAGIQASSRVVAKTTGDVAAKVDFTAADKELSSPVGSAPADSDRWVKLIYDLPKGAALFAGLLSVIFVLGLAIRLVR